MSDSIAEPAEGLKKQFSSDRERTAGSVSITQMVESLRRRHGTFLRRLRADAASQEILDELESFLQELEHAGQLLDRDEERELCQSYLDYWVTKLWSYGRELPNKTLAEFDPALAPELPNDRCPFKGLEAFGAGDDLRFFGREALIKEWLTRLEANRLLCVIGPSGSGKSSLVLAGLLPALLRGQLGGAPKWSHVLKFVPGMTPLRELARALRPESETTPHQILEDAKLLRESPERAASVSSSEPLLCVIDQGEEAFTLCDNEAERSAFLRCIVHLLEAPAPRHTVVLTVRSDLADRFRQTPILKPWWPDAEVNISSLSQADLRRAICQPAEQVGLRIDREVVDRIVQEIHDEPAGLPLLQFTLLCLWERRQRDRITIESYEALGGCRRALERAADALYESMLTEDQQCVRRIMLALIQPGDGCEATRRRVSLEALYYLGDPQERVDRVLAKLTAARLVRCKEGFTAADTVVEISHESLLRNWRLVADWLAAEGDKLRQRRRLSAAAQQWRQRERPAGMLWQPPDLDEASSIPNPDPGEREFLQASQLAHEDTERRLRAAEEQARELERTRALAQEQRLRAEAEALAARRMRWLSVGIFVIALLGALLYHQMQQESERKRVEKRERALESARQLSQQGGHEREALQEVLNSIGDDKQAAAAMSLGQFQTLTTALEASERLIERRLADPGRLLALSPNEEYLLVATLKGFVLHSARTGELVHNLDCKKCTLGLGRFAPPGSQLMKAPCKMAGPKDMTFSMEGFSSDSHMVAAVDEGRLQVVIWDVQTGKQIFETKAERYAGRMTFIPTKDLLATACEGVHAALWDPRTESGPSELGDPYEKDDAPVLQLSASAAGTQLLTIVENRGAYVWDLQTRVVHALESDRLMPQGASSLVRNGAFSPDGRQILVSAGKIAWLYETAGQTKEPRPFIHSTDLTGTEFSPSFDKDGQFATATKDWLYLWSAGDGSIEFSAQATSPPRFVHPPEVLAQTAVVYRGLSSDLQVRQARDGQELVNIRAGRFANAGIMASADGQRLFSVDGDTLRIWNRQGSSVFLPGTWSRSVAICGGGTQVLVAAERQPPSVWSLTGQHRYELPTKGASALAIACAPLGTKAATVHSDQIRLWDLASGRPEALPSIGTTPEGSILALAYSKDGTRLVAVGTEGTGIIYDSAGVERGRLRKPKQGPQSSFLEVAYSPDGQLIATAGEDRRARVFRAADGELVPILTEHTESVTAVSFDASSRWLASGDSGGKVCVRSLDIGSEQVCHSASTSEISAIAFSPSDSQLFVTGGKDRYVMLWNREIWSREKLPPKMTLYGKDIADIEALSFSPDGMHLAVARWSQPALILKFRNPLQAFLRAKEVLANSQKSGKFPPNSRQLGVNDDL
ncbi:MAG: hypothetical protein JNJ46_07310 [Myxococcales bacterium]|nr:hypothetical protein [Myxococcales bacterium]